MGGAGGDVGRARAAGEDEPVLLKVPAVGEPSSAPLLSVVRPAQVAGFQAEPLHFSIATPPDFCCHWVRASVVPPLPESGTRPAEKKL